MLVIRPEQMTAFQPAADKAFARRLAEELLIDHAETAVQLPSGPTTIEDIESNVLEEMVRGGIARSREYGMKSERALAGFVLIMFLYAPNFDEHPLIRRVLTDDEVKPDERIDQLWDRISDQNWEAATRGYDPNAWNVKL